MKRLLTTYEAQEVLGVSRPTLFRLLKAEKLKGFKVGHTWKFEQTDIEDFIRRSREETRYGFEPISDEAKAKQEEKSVA